MRTVEAGGAWRRALSIRMRTTRATAPGSPLPQHGPGGAGTWSSTSASPARSSNSAATARHSSPSSTGSSRSATSASRRLRSSSSLASRARRRSSRWALCTWRRASSWSSRPSRRSSSSSSIVPCSEVSGVRSSCEAVATNERRAASWRRSSRCMVASARARSPTSSRPSSRGVGASVPSRPRGPRRRAVARGAGRCVVARRMPSSDGDQQADSGGGQEGVAHLVDGGGDVGERLLRDEDEVAGRTALRSAG